MRLREISQFANSHGLLDCLTNSAMDAATAREISAGMTAQNANRYRAAIQHYGAAVRALDAAGHTANIDFIKLNRYLAACYDATEEFSLAVQHAERSRSTVHALMEAGDADPALVGEAGCCESTLGFIYGRLGRTIEAIAAYESAQRFLEEGGN